MTVAHTEPTHVTLLGTCGIADFELRELGTETRAGQKTREAKAARAAERAAKRAAKDAKHAELQAKNVKREAKRSELVDALATKLKELATVNADGASTPQVRALAIAAVKNTERLCKRTPRVNFYLTEAVSDDVLVAVGLAHRQGAYVSRDIWRVG